MSDNMIAICLYIGIMAMAGTVLVLTIIYFVRPNPAKKARAAAADVKPVIDDAKPARKKRRFKFPAVKFNFKKKGKELPASADTKPITGAARKAVHKLQFKFPAIKMKLKKTDKAVVSPKPAKMKSKTVVTSVIEMKQPEKRENPVATTGAAEMPMFREVTVAKPTVEVRPANKEVKPEAKPVTRPETKPALVTTAQPVPVKSEKPEQSIPKEMPKPVITASLPVPLPLSAEAAKPKPDAVIPIVNAKEKPAAVEAVKKEPEPTMDNKNIKPVANTAAEKPQTPSVTVKTTTTTTTASATASAAPAKKAPESKTSLDDFSKMFAKEAVDDSEATKLAKDMKEVEVNSLLKEGQDLVALLKRGRS